MSKPKYIKDSKQFTVVFPNVVQDLVESGSRIEREVGIVGNRQIYAFIEKFIQNNTRFIGLYFGQEKRNDEVGEDNIAAVEREIVVAVEGKRPLVDRMGKKGSILRTGDGIGYGDWHPLNTILKKKNGYLKDGALTLHVEMRIHCLIGTDGIRRFNFYDPFENDFKIVNEHWDSPLYIPRRIFLHHYGLPIPPYIPGEPYGIPLITRRKGRKPFVEMYLQILHGVRLELTVDEWRDVYAIGIVFKTDSVVRYCEEYLIRHAPYTFQIEKFIATHPKSWLKWLLKNPSDDRKEVYEVAKKLDASNKEDVKSEHMKAVVKKLFSYA